LTGPPEIGILQVQSIPNMEIIKKIREFFNAKPVGAPVDFSHLSKQKKVEMLEREADVFVKKYGQVIKKLAHE